jgi:predicted GNAT family N-acyltransferase
MTEYEIRRYPGAATIEDAHTVRRIVFIEEQDVSEAEEMDGRDEGAIHVVAYDTDHSKPVGTARLRTPDEGIAKIERVAVLAEYRGKGLGVRLMEAIESEARDEGCSLATLHAQTAVEEFYEALGYRTVSDVFMEAEIPHVEMEKNL